MDDPNSKAKELRLRRELHQEHIKNMWNLLIDRFSPLFEPTVAPTIIYNRGIELHLGWYCIIDELCIKIQNILKKRNSTDFCFFQIKQKFGELRVYFNSHSTLQPDINLVVLEAEEAAKHTCQVCGEPGSMSDNSLYVAVLCPSHQDRESWWP